MSYINVYEISVEDISAGLALEELDANDADHTLTDGEELAAAATIIRALNELDNGEALVITRDIF